MIHLVDLEAAINFWREREPSPDGVSLSPAVRSLASVYALMVFQHWTEYPFAQLSPEAKHAWLAWYDTTPDTPCIAICSTSQGDPECKGCGRSFEEVQYWTEMSPGAKRHVWRRITLSRSSWRFNRYSERAAEGITSATSGQ